MTEWLKLSDDQKRNMFGIIEYTRGIREEAMEKDMWVTITLKALFASKYKNYLIFKGGTSLSKCWKLIDRFSEDIDIALDSEAFGKKYEENPSNTSVKKLKRAGCEFTSNELKKDLEQRFIELGVPGGMIRVEAEPIKEDMPDTDPQTLLIHYPSLYESHEYLANVVKVEVSVRSLKEPKATIAVQSLLSELTENDTYKEIPFEVVAVEAQRTFLEKMFLLHEEFQKTEVTKIRSHRMSRHLYDLERMMDKDAGIKALANIELYDVIIKHRSAYSKLPNVDYNLHKRETLSFIPPDHIIEAYAKDYETMRAVMIYSNSKNFKDLIRRLNTLTARFKTNELIVTKVISDEPEYPPYKFYKEGYDLKDETRSIYIDEELKVLRLANISLSSMEEMNKLSLEIIIESNDSEKKIHRFNLSDLTTTNTNPNRLFFDDKNRYIEIALPVGPNKLTAKINLLSDAKDFDMQLACEYA